MNKVARSNRGKAVLGVQLGHERAWQRRRGLTAHGFKRRGLGQSARNQGSLGPLERENVELRGSELSPNLGDGRGQAGVVWACDLTTSVPSVNFIPRMIFGNWLWPLRRRQLFSAASASLKIMASAVLFERHPLERTVR